MARNLRPTRPAGSSGPTDPVEALRSKIKVKVHGKPEDLATHLILWAEYTTDSDIESLTELFKCAPPAIKAQLVKLFPEHEVIKKNSKTAVKKPDDADPVLVKEVEDLRADGKKKGKIEDLLLDKYPGRGKDIDVAIAHVLTSEKGS